MSSIRFGAVSSVYYISKEKAKTMVSPTNRVLTFSNTLYLVTGQDDIQMVDELIRHRNALTEAKETNMASQVNNSLYRFLNTRANVKTDMNYTDVVAGTLEVL